MINNRDYLLAFVLDSACVNEFAVTLPQDIVYTCRKWSSRLVTAAADIEGYYV